jgi:penicillin-binding protein 1A
MADGFAVFANGGWRVTPYFVEKVADSTGAVVFTAEPPLACPQCTDTSPVDTGTGAEPAATGGAQAPPGHRAPRAISAANAYIMTDIMTDVIQRGTAQRAKVLGRRDIAGKTGTTSDRRDAWFVGFNADIVAAAWIGFDQERSLGESEEGGHTALPMWIYFMQEALRGRPEHRLPEPPGVVRMWVSRETGAPAGAGSSGAIFEAFLEQHTPQTGQPDYGEGVDAESVTPQSSDDSIF